LCPSFFDEALQLLLFGLCFFDLMTHVVRVELVFTMITVLVEVGRVERIFGVQFFFEKGHCLLQLGPFVFILAFVRFRNIEAVSDNTMASSDPIIASGQRHAESD
jgi:hypothetical protein